MPKPEPITRHPETLDRVHALIVDDDAGLVRLIEKRLQHEGFTTANARRGCQAIDWLSTHRADLLLLDLKLQDVDGQSLIRQLEKAGLHLPFIVITGQGDERVAVEMMKRGAIDYLVKDSSFLQRVPEVVRRALQQVAAEKKLSAAKEALRRSEANLAKAQAIAHLGSYEISIPFSANDYRSDEIFRILGVSPGRNELSTDEYVSRFVHPDDRAHYREAVTRAAQTARSLDFEYRIVRTDGTIRQVHSIAEPELDGSGKVVGLVGTLMDVTERKHLEQALLDISDREQRRIGQDLHDGLGQHLAGIELMSEVLEKRLGDRKLKSEAIRASQIAHHVREAIGQTRLLARGLCPVVLESGGLMDALGELASTTSKMSGVKCRFQCPAPVLVADHSIATHLYRIAQEAVSNAIKHGKAREIQLVLRQKPGQLRLEVRDNGIGLANAPADRRGMGLRIMQYRARAMGGALLVESAPTGGTVVICSVNQEAKRI